MISDDDMQRLHDLIAEITEILPEFDAVMLSEDALILTTVENLENISEAADVDISFEDDVDEFAKMLGFSDDEDDGSGGILQ